MSYFVPSYVILWKSMQWRDEQKIDSIMSEEIDPFILSRCHYDVRGHDAEGRPVLVLHGGNWDIKDFIEANKAEQLYRHIYKMIERVAITVRNNMRKNVKPGYIGIIDADGTTYRQVGSKEAMSAMLHFICTIRDNYPDLLSSCFVINCPKFVSFIFRMIKPLLPARVQARIHIYGRNKKEWQQALLKVVPRDQLSKNYGGILES